MKGCYTINLRIWLPVFICVVLVGVFGGWLAVHYHDLRDKHRTEHIAHWREALSRIQSMLGGEMDAEYEAKARNFLRSFHTDSGLRALVLIDHHDRIIGGSNPAWEHQSPVVVLPDFSVEQAANVVAADSPTFTFDAGRDRLVGYYPIPLQTGPVGENATAVGETGRGLLFLDYDLAHGRQEIFTELREDAAVMLGLVAVGLLVSLGFAYLFVGRPLRLLINTMRKTRPGDIPALHFRGYGEFAYLGRVIYAARKELQKTLVDLYGREQRLDRTLEAIAEGVVVTDQHGIVERINPAAERMTGWSREDVCGEPVSRILRLIDATTGELIPSPVSRAIDTKAVVEITQGIRLVSDAASASFHVAGNAAPIFNAEGYIDGVTLTIRNVSDEYRVREERRLTASVFESLDPTLIADVDKTIVQFNRACAEVSGYGTTELLGKSLYQFYAHINDESLREFLENQDQSCRAWRGKTFHRHRDGSVRHFLECITAVADDTDTVTHFIVTQRDITDLVRTGNALQDSQSKYLRLVESLYDGSAVIRDGVFVECNNAVARILQRPRSEILWQSPVDFSPHFQPCGELSRTKAEGILQGVAEGSEGTFEWLFAAPNGTVIQVEASLNRILLEGKSAVVCTFRDIGERKRQEREREALLDTLEQKEKMTRLATIAGGIAIWEFELSSLQTVRVQGLAEILELPADQSIESFAQYRDYIHPDDVEMVEDVVAKGKNDGLALKLDYRLVTAQGKELWVRTRAEFEKNSDGECTLLRGVIVDATEARDAQNEIERLAYYDALTGLANRRLLLDRLDRACTQTARNGNNGALLFIDLDRFKLLNDSLGHRAGDILLQRVANRLCPLLREEDTVARLGGDEFVVMLPTLSSDIVQAANQAALVGEKILEVLTDSYELGGHSYHISASIGVALFPQDGARAEVALNHADVAMYQAKSRGRNTLAFYQPALQANADARLMLEQDLRNALRKNELEIHYQPQADVRRRVVGAEGLLRWQHPERGMVMPNEFIPIAEETGLIVEIGSWVLRTACVHAAKWQTNTQGKSLGISINVSPVQFRHPGFVAEVTRAVEEAAIAPELVTLEITEGLLIDDLDKAVATLKALKALGVRISIDDFGTGYSSLYYLKHLPIDELKIDRAYVKDIHFDKDDAAIVETIIAMAKHLRLSTVAEGVETEAQLAFLQKNGCVVFQGYLFSKPISGQEFSDRYIANGDHGRGESVRVS